MFLAWLDKRQIKSLLELVIQYLSLVKSKILDLSSICILSIDAFTFSFVPLIYADN